MIRIELFDSTVDSDQLEYSERQQSFRKQRRMSSFLYSVEGNSVVDDDSKVLYN